MGDISFACAGNLGARPAPEAGIGLRQRGRSPQVQAARSAGPGKVSGRVSGVNGARHPQPVPWTRPTVEAQEVVAALTADAFVVTSPVPALLVNSCAALGRSLGISEPCGNARFSTGAVLPFRLALGNRAREHF